jgi:hypothetical protein
MDKFLNFYSKYLWVAIAILIQCLATTFTIIYASGADNTKIMGAAFFAIIIYSYFGFKVPKA